MKSLVLRAAARGDVDPAVNYYLRDADREVVLGFIAALEKTYRSIANRPAAGSSHLGSELDLAGLRSKRLAKFPYLVFYVERPNHIDVWRVLHTRRDIPASLAILRD